MDTIELHDRTGQEVYEELKHRLEGMSYLSDEYFLLDASGVGGRRRPRVCPLCRFQAEGGPEPRPDGKPPRWGRFRPSLGRSILVRG